MSNLFIRLFPSIARHLTLRSRAFEAIELRLKRMAAEARALRHRVDAALDRPEGAVEREARRPDGTHPRHGSPTHRRLFRH